MEINIEVSEYSKDTLQRLKVIEELYRKHPNCSYSDLYKLVMTNNNVQPTTPRKPLFLAQDKPTVTAECLEN
jgi:hypothetical protein